MKGGTILSLSLTLFLHKTCNSTSTAQPTPNVNDKSLGAKVFFYRKKKEMEDRKEDKEIKESRRDKKVRKYRTQGHPIMAFPVCDLLQASSFSLLRDHHYRPGQPRLRRQLCAFPPWRTDKTRVAIVRWQGEEIGPRSNFRQLGRKRKRRGQCYLLVSARLIVF